MQSHLLPHFILLTLILLICVSLATASPMTNRPPTIKSSTHDFVTQDWILSSESVSYAEQTLVIECPSRLVCRSEHLEEVRNECTYLCVSILDEEIGGGSDEMESGSSSERREVNSCDEELEFLADGLKEDWN